MSDDPDELRAEQAARQNDPRFEVIEVINEIETHLRYGIPSFKFLGWITIVLLALILWRIW